ncbi:MULTISPECIES: hypothetical protein [unclassified Streptomyces]|uniref:hypothetical protein n=1 Tax=unclassified Streptomyces TaxID=2593676 RepID=UPI002740E137|nr:MULTISPECIES: hypothetical protein [unclassified Streptomyces]
MVTGASLILVATALLIAFLLLGWVYLRHVRGFSGLVLLPEDEGEGDEGDEGARGGRDRAER